MQFDSNKIYVCTNLVGGEDVQVLIKTNLDNELRWTDFHHFTTFPFEKLNKYQPNTKDKLYILDNIYDLADFIQGKRDFPIFKTNEEEQKEKDEEAKKSQECDNHTTKLDKLRDVIDYLFDGNLEKEGGCTATNICKGRVCSDSDFDCRNCLMDYIQRIVA